MTLRILMVIFISLLISCKDNKQTKSESIWSNTIQTTLEGESINFKRPKNLKRSSRYRIKEDIPILKNDTAKLYLIQKALESLEFEDSEIDVFVDTSTIFRVVIMCNTPRIDFNKNDIGLLKLQLEDKNRLIEQENPVLSHSIIKAQLKKNSKLTIAKYKYEVLNSLNENRVYNSLYYLTSPAFTLVVYEFSDNEKDIEKYLWSVKI